MLPWGPGHCTVGSEGDVPDKPYQAGAWQVTSVCVVWRWYIESVVVTMVPDKLVLTKWAFAGDARLLRTRRQDTGQAVFATGNRV